MILDLNQIIANIVILCRFILEDSCWFQLLQQIYSQATRIVLFVWLDCKFVNSWVIFGH